MRGEPGPADGNVTTVDELSAKVEAFRDGLSNAWEAIERLAEASARVRLSDEVTKEDVDRALSLVRKSMQQGGIDPETGKLDADVVETGQSKSQRDRRKQVRAIIADRNGTTVTEVADIVKMDEAKIEHDIQALRNRGEIYERNGEIRLT